MLRAGNRIVRLEGADLFKHPGQDTERPPHPDNQVTKGDAHGSMLNIAYTAVRQHFLEMSEADYAELARIYHIHHGLLTKADLQQFRDILQRSRVNAKGTLRLTGDVLADRGICDFRTLLFLALLIQNGLKVEILLSNHDSKFIECYEKKLRFNLVGDTFKSINSIQALIDRGMILKEEVNTLIDTIYKPNLKLISYTLNGNNKITIYSHAGIDLSTIQGLAKQFKVEYKDDTALELAETIDRLNAAFAVVVKENRLHEYFKGYDTLLESQLSTNPLIFTLWNRDHQRLVRPANYKNYAIDFAHGHHTELSQGNIFCLNNMFGMPSQWHVPIYEVLWSQESPGPQLQNDKQVPSLATAVEAAQAATSLPILSLVRSMQMFKIEPATNLDAAVNPANELRC